MKVINTIDYETFKKDITVNKNWVETSDVAEHDTITINLYQNESEEVFATKTIENGKTSCVFDNLPKYDVNGEEYTYVAKEVEVEGYTTTYSDDTLTIANTIIDPENVEIKGTKTWIDPEGTEHPEITIRLLQNGIEIKDTKLSNEKTDYEFTGLPKYIADSEGKYILDDNGNVQLNVYTVIEDRVEGYSSKQDGYNFINTINQEEITVNGTKTWIDPVGTIHKTITVRLYQDGTEIANTEIENDETSYSFEKLEKYAQDGHIYNYTVTEDSVDGYTSTQNGYNFTNTINQDNTISVSGTKTWIDPVGTTHPTITIRLLQDGTEIEHKDLENGKTTYSFTGLNKYASDGHIYNYTVSEDSVDGYTSTQSGNNFTNTINQETISVAGTKTWIDPEGTIHKTITVRLYQDGTEIANTEIENDETSYSFEKLEKYAQDGHIYNYTVTEDSVDGYTSTQNGYNFTNTINQEKITVAGTKTWIDPEGTTHPEITINLLRDETKVAEKKIANGETSYLFGDLDKYAADGHIYNYTVTENDVTGYTSVQDEYNFTNTIEQVIIAVNGTKTWKAPAGITHPNITIRLFKDGKEINHQTLINGTTTYSFAGLEKYDLSTGREYVYTVEEDALSNYSSEKDGTNFINTIKQQKIEVSGTKTWIDPVGTIHPTITINLLRNGNVVESKELVNGTKTYTFTNLDKYDLSTGEEYVYTVSENEVNGYTSVQSGNNFINTIKQQKIEVAGTKTWVDKDENVQHPEITINLLRDGKKVDSIKLTNGKTSYSFKDLDKYDLATGKEYAYTVTEDQVQNYIATIDGYNITNTFDQDFKGTVSVTSTTVSTTTVPNPLDVVFVLDVSGSMNDDSKASKMVSSVNTAMKTILSGSDQSRVGIVTFSGETKNLVALAHYDVKDQYLSLRNKTITASVGGNQSVSVNGGTYTQAGIKAGAKMLTSATTTATLNINNENVTVTRTPILILLTDGEPTYYSTSINDPESVQRSGTGASSDAEHYYYTIRTAAQCKADITSHYYANTSSKAKFYTIGFGMNENDLLQNTVLNPTKANIDRCNEEGTSTTSGRGGSNTSRNTKGKLYDKLYSTGTPYAYSYSDQLYIGGNLDLTSILNTIVEQNSTSTSSRAITEEESNARRVDLVEIDIAKAFGLKIGSKTYSTFAAAKDAGYVKGDSSSGYYVDFSKEQRGITIEISYNK